MTIVVMGSLHYDIMMEVPNRPRKGETVAGDRWYPKFGGKGGNQAVAAAMAGAPTKFVGAVGQDNFADMLRGTLEKHGIATDHIAVVEGQGSGMSVAMVYADGDYGAIIVSGANKMIDAAQFDSEALWDSAQILLLQNEVPEAVNIAAARAAKQRGVNVCLNAAPMRQLSQDMINLLDILVVNAVEAEDITGQPVYDRASAKKAASALSDKIPTVIVTVGGDGVAWSEQNQGADSIPARQVTLVSTHGAGDVFIGTLCHEIARKSELRDAIEVANEAAAQHVSKTHD